MAQLGHNQGDAISIPYGGFFSEEGDGDVTWAGEGGTYKKLAASTSSALKLNFFTHTSSSRLTYTGDRTRLFLYSAKIVVVPSGLDQDILKNNWRLRLAINGTTLASSTKVGMAITENQRVSLTGYGIFQLVKNDYVEMFATTATGADTDANYSSACLTLEAIT